MATEPAAEAASKAPPRRAAKPKPERRFSLHGIAAITGDIRMLAVNLAVLGLIVLLGPVIVTQFFRTQVLIGPISIPAALQRTGLTPEVAAARLRDGIAQVQNVADTQKKALAAIPEGQEVDFSIPDSGISIDSLVYYVRDFFHIYEIRISGELRCDNPACVPAETTLRLRVTGPKQTVISLPRMGEMDEDAYFHEAAGEVMRVLDPFTAIAADSRTDPHRAMVAARLLIAQHHKDSKWAYNLLGNLLQDEEKYDDSIAAYRAALKIDPNFVPALVNLGSMLDLKGDVAASKRAFERAFRLSPTNLFSLLGMARAARTEQKMDVAINFYERAAEVDPDDPMHLLAAATLAQTTGRQQKANELLDRILEVEPDNETAILLRSYEFIIADDYSGAERLYAEALLFSPQNTSLLSNDAHYLRMLGRNDEALARIEQALSVEPDTAEFHFDRGELLVALDRKDEAVDEMSRAIALDPEGAGAYFSLGYLQRDRGNMTEAVAAWKSFLAHAAPDDPLRNGVLTSLQLAGETVAATPPR